MQVQKVQNNFSCSQTFKGEIVDTYALRKLKAGLSDVEADCFEKCIKEINKVKDGKFYEYKPSIVGNNKTYKIYKLDKNGNEIDPPMFVDSGERPVKVFEQLSNWYKEYVVKHI